MTWGQPQHLQQAERGFPLSPEFQEMLFRILLEDREFSGPVYPHVKPSYWQSPIHQWAWGIVVAYRERYGALPTVLWLVQAAFQLPPDRAPIYAAAMDRLRCIPTVDEPAVKDLTLDFLRRAIFRQAFLDCRDLFNAGQVDPAYDHMQMQMDALRNVSLRKTGRAWLADEFVDRHVARQDVAFETRRIPTGIPDLDRIFDGGVYPGFLGLWLAYAKGGKTTLLINHGAVAMRLFHKRVFHAVLEGNLNYIVDRYDSLMLDEMYSSVKHGDVDSVKYARTFQEYQSLKGLHVVQDYTQGWETSILQIHNDLKDLEQTKGWKPDLIIVDYADLLKGRKSSYKSTTDEQKDSFQDLKQLANRGVAIWTASQVQRPRDDNAKLQQEVLTSKSIADCYAKVRIADFVGSLNQTDEEKKQKVMRLHAELYRDGAAGDTFTINADFSKMTFGAGAQGMPAAAPTSPTKPAVPAGKPLGYGGLRQARNGV